jgi:Pyruvate phosphate dikinase, AMP/ATP-binding domain
VSIRDGGIIHFKVRNKGKCPPIFTGIEYRRLRAIPDDLYTAATIHRMVFGNAGGTSGAGVGFTRDPDSGEKRLYFDFLFNSQGEDIVSGRASGSDAERLFTALPEIRQELDAICSYRKSLIELNWERRNTGSVTQLFKSLHNCNILLIHLMI